MTTRFLGLHLASLALLLCAVCEIGVYPVAWWVYACIVSAFAASLIRPMPARSQMTQLSVVVAIIAVVVALHLVDWTTRKPFLRDLARVRVGMTEPEVRRIMSRYMEGTGWPGIPGTSSNAPGMLNILGSGSRYSTGASPMGQMVILDSLVYRHSNVESDWGVIEFSRGKVTRVEFCPD